MPTEILVIREKDRFSEILTKRGFSVTNFPLIKTEPLADLSDLESCLAEIETFDGIFVTSVKATEIVLAKLGETRKDFRGKFFVLGKKSNDLLVKSGCKTFFREQAAIVEEFLRLIPKDELRNKRFLFPRGNRSLRIVPETLGEIADVRETVVYETIDVDYGETEINFIKDKLTTEKFAAVCFFSPSGVEGFLRKFENLAQNDLKVAAIGKTTARFAEDNNLRVDFIATKTAAADFALELVNFLNKTTKH